MYKRTKRTYTRKRKYTTRKSSTKYAKPTKAFAKAVKKVILKTHETKKRYTFGISIGTPVNSSTVKTWYGLNPLFHISQGTGDDDRIGDKIHVKGISLKGLFTQVSTGARPYPLHLTVMAWWAKEDQSSGVADPTFSSGIYPKMKNLSGSNFASIIAFTDTEKTSVVFKRRFLMPTETTSVTGYSLYPEKWLDMWLPINKTIQYSADNGGYLKGKNLYIGYFFDFNGGLADTGFGGTLNMCVYYKDV